MLDELTATNLGLIPTAEVRLAEGLTVITGETGTGKTLMLGALRLLRGDTARKGVIGPAGDTCEVSARFLDGDEEHIARRHVDATRSRAYLDGVAATAGDLAEALAHRVAIIGQHDQLTITSAAGVRSLIDRGLDDDGIGARDAYGAAWSHAMAIRAEMEALGGDLRSIERDRDIAQYQVAEIDEADLDPVEDGQLRDRVVALRNVDALLGEVDRAASALGGEGVEPVLDAAAVAMRAAAGFDTAAGELADRIDDISSLVNEVSRDIAAYAAGLDADPDHLASMEQRLHLLGELRRKYGDTVEDILGFRKQAAETAARLSGMLDAAADIEERAAAARATVEHTGERLRQVRQHAADEIAALAREHLTDLGFTDPIVRITVEPAEPTGGGADRAVVLFASTSDLDPGPVSSIASGGELSRLVLALTLAAGSPDTTTIAFDEIDTGIGGTTALAMGEKLKALAQTRQVVCVSHLPQVAAHADVHLRVTREGSVASVERLVDEERVMELTRMLSGLEGSEPGIDHARELLAHARGT
jgi:DNA repair protein RecN (Recombination protein N)